MRAFSVIGDALHGRLTCGRRASAAGNCCCEARCCLALFAVLHDLLNLFRLLLVPFSFVEQRSRPLLLSYGQKVPSPSTQSQHTEYWTLTLATNPPLALVSVFLFVVLLYALISPTPGRTHTASLLAVLPSPREEPQLAYVNPFFIILGRLVVLILIEDLFADKATYNPNRGFPYSRRRGPERSFK